MVSPSAPKATSNLSVMVVRKVTPCSEQKASGEEEIWTEFLIVFFPILLEVVQEIKMFNLDDTKQLTWSGYKRTNFFTLLEPCRETSQTYYNHYISHY